MFSLNRGRSTMFIALLILIILNLCLLYYYLFCTLQKTRTGFYEVTSGRIRRPKLNTEILNTTRQKLLLVKSQNAPVFYPKVAPKVPQNFDLFSWKFNRQQNETKGGTRSFVVDYEHDCFLKDGKPFRILSGSIDYFRVPRAYWRDRLHKLRAAGFNSVSMYIEWVTHEPKPEEYKFNGEQDLEHFINLAIKEDLFVILRPGPYICAERDAGGYPTWLLNKHPFLKYRTTDRDYKMEVEKWFSILMPRIVKYLYGNGGPIIMVAVENEYVTLPDCNMMYKLWLKNLIEHYVGNSALLFTTDHFWAAMGMIFKCGSIPGVYQAFDFGYEDINATIMKIRWAQSKGPIFSAEFWGGWPSYWSLKRNRVSVAGVEKTVKRLLDIGASINIHMFHGGTNFGFHNGANSPPNAGWLYYPIQTSYDYDAPLDEAGDPTDKYYTFRNLLSHYTAMPNISLPKPAPKGNYGKVAMKPVISLFDSRVPNDGRVFSFNPKSFEDLDIQYGYVLYETYIPLTWFFSILSVPGLKDRGHLYIDQTYRATLNRNWAIFTPLIFTGREKKLNLLVENQGRYHIAISVDSMMERKGLTATPSLNFIPLTNWVMTKYSLENVSWVENIQPSSLFIFPPAFYIGYFIMPSYDTPLDTYVNLSGWGKGVLFVNGFNLGRYWPTVGSQITLYLPGCYLRPAPEKNVFVMFETDFQSSTRQITLQSQPILNGPSSGGFML